MTRLGFIGNVLESDDSDMLELGGVIETDASQQEDIKSKTSKEIQVTRYERTS